MSKKDVDARKVLEMLQDMALELGVVAERLGVSREAVDEARCLADEMESAEVDAILAMPPNLGRALLWSALAKDRTDVLAAAAAEGDKELQREVKRIAHNLKLRGVELALPARPPEPQRPQQPEAPAAEPPVFLSSLDANGERAVFWTRILPGRGIELAQLVVSDERGIVDLYVGELSRKRFREVLEELPRRGGVTIREVDRKEARVAIDRARVAARQGGECPPHFSAWAAQVLGPAPAEAPPPLAPIGEGLPEPDPAVQGELLAASEVLLDEPELARWAPSDEALRSCAQQVEQAAGSPLYVNEAEREAAIRAAIERSAARFFDEKRRALWAARLLDSGRTFEATGRIRAARIATTVARTLASGAPVERIPFCTRLFARLFGRQQAKAPSGPTASSLLLPEERLVHGA